MLLRTQSPASPSNTIAAVALVIAIVAAATLAGAWLFQYGFGLAPCPLCLQQRVPYYAAVPLAALIVLAAARNAPTRILRAGLGLLALVWLASAALGVYHAGVEWNWWPGPQDCAGAGFTPGAGGLLQQMQTARVVRCDDAAWRFLGLSLAGYNAVISLALAGLAIGAAFHRPRP